MFQEVTLIGRLGQDPQARQTAQGAPVTSFSVATDRTWTDTNGQRQQRTVWFQVSAWNGLAAPCAQYLHKGSLVMVQGEMLEPRVYTDRQGVQRAGLQVTASLVKFLSSNGQPVPLDEDAPPQRRASAEAQPLDEEEIPF
jgi:single-strand DNA-binding protein